MTGMLLAFGILFGSLLEALVDEAVVFETCFLFGVKVDEGLRKRDFVLTVFGTDGLAGDIVLYRNAQVLGGRT